MSTAAKSSGIWLRLHGALVIGFLMLPIVVAVIVSFNDSARVDFPPSHFGLRWFRYVLDSSPFLEGLGNSLIIGVASALIATVAGTAAAIAFNHYRFFGRAALQACMMLPVALPAIVVGLGLLYTLPILGLESGLLAGTLGHAVIGVPYVIAMVLASLAQFDRSLERASLNLGVGPVRTFFRITLPLIRGGVIAGGIAAFLISLDNISLSLFITHGDTLPLRLMQHMLSYSDPSVAAMSTLLLLLSLILLFMLLPLVTRRPT